MEGDAIFDADMLWNSVAVNANKLERVNTRGLALWSQVKIDMVNDFTSLSEYKSAVSWRNSTNISRWGNYSERKGCTRQKIGWLHQILAAQPHWLQWTVQTRASTAKSSYLSSNFRIDALFFCFMALGSATDWLSIYFVALTELICVHRGTQSLRQILKSHGNKSYYTNHSDLVKGNKYGGRSVLTCICL